MACRLGKKRRKSHWHRVWDLPSSFCVYISFNTALMRIHSLIQGTLSEVIWGLQAELRNTEKKKKKTWPLPSRCSYASGMVTHESVSCNTVLGRTRHHGTYTIFTYLFPLSPLTVLLMAVLLVSRPAVVSTQWRAIERMKNIKKKKMPGKWRSNTKYAWRIYRLSKKQCSKQFLEND